MTDVGATFERLGLTWRRQWSAPKDGPVNSGGYVWSCGLLTAWRDGHDYRFAVDGRVSPLRAPSLRDAMDAAAQSADDVRRVG